MDELGEVSTQVEVPLKTLKGTVRSQLKELQGFLKEQNSKGKEEKSKDPFVRADENLRFIEGLLLLDTSGLQEYLKRTGEGIVITKIPHIINPFSLLTPPLPQKRLLELRSDGLYHVEDRYFEWRNRVTDTLVTPPYLPELQTADEPLFKKLASLPREEIIGTIIKSL